MEEKWGNFDRSLKELYPRLYRLESCKECKVKDRVSWSENRLVLSWAWSSELREREVGWIREIEQKWEWCN